MTVNHLVGGSIPPVAAIIYGEWRNGSRAGLRNQWRNLCEFESHLAHQRTMTLSSNGRTPPSGGGYISFDTDRGLPNNRGSNDLKS